MIRKIYVIAVCVFFVSLGHAQEPDTTSLTRTEQMAPAFSIETLDGKMVNSADLEGKVILLNFFATWCPPCNAELPELEKKVWKQWKGNPNFILLSVGREHTREELNAFRKEHGYTFPMAADTERSVYSKFARAYIPRNYVIGPGGRIAYQGIGFEKEEFAAMIQTISDLLRKTE